MESSRSFNCKASYTILVDSTLASHILFQGGVGSLQILEFSTPIKLGRILVGIDSGTFLKQIFPCLADIFVEWGCALYRSWSIFCWSNQASVSLAKFLAMWRNQLLESGDGQDCGSWGGPEARCGVRFRRCSHPSIIRLVQSCSC